MEENIQLYINGELKGAALQSFENQLRTDSALQEEVAFSKKMILALQNKEALELHQQLQNIAASTAIEPDFEQLKAYEKAVNGGNGWSGKMPWIGGALGLIIVIASIFWWTSSADNSFTPIGVQNEIVQNWLSPFEMMIYANPASDENLQLGIAAYKNENYQEAAAVFEKYTATNNDPQVKLYLGVSQLMNGAAEKATITLEEVAEDQDSPLGEAGKWYLALSYLELNRVGEARNLLEQIGENGMFGSDVSLLLEELDRELIQ